MYPSPLACCSGLLSCHQGMSSLFHILANPCMGWAFISVLICVSLITSKVEVFSMFIDHQLYSSLWIICLHPLSIFGGWCGACYKACGILVPPPKVEPGPRQWNWVLTIGLPGDSPLPRVKKSFSYWFLGFLYIFWMLIQNYLITENLLIYYITEIDLKKYPMWYVNRYSKDIFL